jgi:hypothetical protein
MLAFALPVRTVEKLALVLSKLFSILFICCDGRVLDIILALTMHCFHPVRFTAMAAFLEEMAYRIFLHIDFHFLVGRACSHDKAEVV